MADIEDKTAPPAADAPPAPKPKKKKKKKTGFTLAEEDPAGGAADAAPSSPTKSKAVEEEKEGSGEFRMVIESSLDTCRYYEKRFPALEDLVKVRVQQIEDMGAYVSLLEYGGIEGMILSSELSRRRIRSINKLIRVGKDEVVMVIRVDEAKGYIDLSKRRVAREDEQACTDRYNKAKMVHSILGSVSSKLKVALEDLYVRIGWPLYKKYGHCYDAFQRAVAAPADVFGNTPLAKPEELEMIRSEIQRRMAPTAIKIRADIQVTCYTYEGVEAIRRALIAAEGYSTPEMPIKVQLVAPPLYVMLGTTYDRDTGIATLTKAVETVKEVITAEGGEMQIHLPPRVTTDLEEASLDKEIVGEESSDED